MFDALKEKKFLLYWMGQLTSVVGDSLVPVAVTFAVLKMTGSAVDLRLYWGRYGEQRFFLITWWFWVG